MCGILGVCLDIKATRTFSDMERMKLNFAELLVSSQARGRDAAGAYVVNKNSDVIYFKAPMTASDLIDTDSFWKMLNDYVGENTVAIIGHTRAATTGSPKCNDNNHPVVDLPIIGVHNGVIRNHLELGRQYKKSAEVDSAAIMALLRVKSGKKPLTVETMTKNLHKLDGPFAIAVADTRKPDSVYLARNGNPVVFHRDRSAGLLWFASTEAILRDGLELYATDKVFEMPGNSACRIDSKAVRRKLKFQVLKSASSTAKSAAVTPMKFPSATVRKPSNAAILGEGRRSAYKVPSRGNYHREPQVQCGKCGTAIYTVFMGSTPVETCGCKPLRTLFD